MPKVFYRFLRSVTSLIQRAEWNSDISTAVDNVKNFIGHANKRIEIVSGDLDHVMFDRPDILEKLREAITKEKNPVHIEILCGPDPDPETKGIWELAKKSGGNLQIIKLPQRPQAHYMLVDDNNVRIEQFHKPYEPERKAYIKKGTLFLGSILHNDFASLKRSASPPK